MSLKAILWVLDESETTLGARLTLLALADYAHDDGSRSFPSVATIAKKARLSERGARAALRKLEDEGHILKTGESRYGTAVYRILMGEEASSPGGEVHDRDRASASPNPSSNPSSPSEKDKKRASAPVTEPITFGEWIGYHCIAADRTVPRAGTSARAKLAATYAALEGEGYSLGDFKLATDGVLADPYMVEHGYTKPENVLRKEKIAGRVDDGRRARAVSSKPLTAEEQRAAEWREQQRVASEYQPEDPYADEAAS